MTYNLFTSGASSSEQAARMALVDLVAKSPIPPDEFPDNLALYANHLAVGYIVELNCLYQRVLKLPGFLVEFGCRYGRNLSTLVALRELMEPRNPRRRILGFDTFTGFPEHPTGATHREAKVGGLGCAPGAADHLAAVLETLESASALSHIKRFDIIAGDIRKTAKAYFQKSDINRVAMAILDVDTNAATEVVLDVLSERLEPGGLIVFDNYLHPNWPGETEAVRRHPLTRDCEIQSVRSCGILSFCCPTRDPQSHDRNACTVRCPSKGDMSDSE